MEDLVLPLDAEPSEGDLLEAQVCGDVVSVASSTSAVDSWFSVRPALLQIPEKTDRLTAPTDLPRPRLPSPPRPLLRRWPTWSLRPRSPPSPDPAIKRKSLPPHLPTERRPRQLATLPLPTNRLLVLPRKLHPLLPLTLPLRRRNTKALLRGRNLAPPDRTRDVPSRREV